MAVSDGHRAAVRVAVNVMTADNPVEGKSVLFESAGELAGGDAAGNVQTVTTTAGDSSSIAAAGTFWPFSIRISTSAWSSS